MRVRILVIDDEESICEILKYNLEKEGYDVDCANSAEEAFSYDLSSYSLFMVDIVMDRLSGFDFVKRLKNTNTIEDTPIIFCSALSGEDDLVMGLNIGGDDYITKPFAINEVLARVRAVLRRSNISQQLTYNRSQGICEPDITFRGVRVNRNEKICYVNGVPANLTRTELELLLFFLTHRNRVYNRDEIKRHIWAGDESVSNRAIDTNLTRLRKKLGEYGVFIKTRSGFGYGFSETD